MITAETLQTLTTFTAPALARALDVSGYRDCEFKSARFLGMTNGGQFCYSVTYFNEHIGEDDHAKVFLSYDPTEGRVTAEF